MSIYSKRLAKYRPFHYWGRSGLALPVVMQKKETKAKPSSGQDIKDKVFALSIGYDWIRFFCKNIFTFLALFTGLVFFLFARIESRIDKMEASTKQDIQKLEVDIKEIRTLLLQLIQKQTRTSQK